MGIVIALMRLFLLACVLVFLCGIGLLFLLHTQTNVSTKENEDDE
jgi:hypothetical protein